MNVEILKSFGLIYLGSPYTRYPEGLDQAFEDISKIAARLVDQHIDLYAPIVHCHPIAKKCKKISAIDGKFWMGFHAPFIRAANTLVVAKMESWEKSVGLKEEIELFEASKKFIFYLDPKTDKVTMTP